MTGQGLAHLFLLPLPLLGLLSPEFFAHLAVNLIEVDLLQSAVQVLVAGGLSGHRLPSFQLLQGVRHHASRRLARACDLPATER